MIVVWPTHALPNSRDLMFVPTTLLIWVLVCLTTCTGKRSRVWLGGSRSGPLGRATTLFICSLVRKATKCLSWEDKGEEWDEERDGRQENTKSTEGTRFYLHWYLIRLLVCWGIKLGYSPLSLPLLSYSLSGCCSHLFLQAYVYYCSCCRYLVYDRELRCILLQLVVCMAMLPCCQLGYLSRFLCCSLEKFWRYAFFVPAERSPPPPRRLLLFTRSIHSPVSCVCTLNMCNFSDF